MATVLAFRIAVALTVAGHRVVLWSQGPGVDTGHRISQELLRRIGDPSETDANLTAAVAAETGTLANVATYTGSFECRKLHVTLQLLSGASVTDDVRVMTFHLLKLASGSPSATWVESDFTTVETAWDAFWTANKANYPAELRLAQYRWYKAGPSIAPPQEPVRVVDRAVIGTGATGKQLPHQVATSVTEKTSSRKAWGRFYMPAIGEISSAMDGTSGRWSSGYLTTVANATDTLYEACKAAGTPIVVYSAAKPERPKRPSGTLPAIGARALTVDDIQVDDIPDIIRSRRLTTVLLRVQRAIA